MPIKVVAAAIAAIFLLAGNSALAAVPWAKIDPQQAAAPLVRMAYAVATGGNAEIKCRNLHWGPEDCAEFVDNLKLSMRAVAGPILSKHARHTGLYPAHQRRLDGIMADSSDAILQLAAMLPPGEMGRCVVQQYDAALQNVVDQHHGRLVKRNSKRASKKSQKNKSSGAANTQMVTVPAEQKELRVPGATTKVDAAAVALVNSSIHKTINAVEKRVVQELRELPGSNSEVDSRSVERVRDSVIIGTIAFATLLCYVGVLLFGYAVLHNLPDEWQWLLNWGEIDYWMARHGDPFDAPSEDPYEYRGWQCNWSDAPLAPATAYFTELVGLMMTGSAAWLLRWAWLFSWKNHGNYEVEDWDLSTFDE